MGARVGYGIGAALAVGLAMWSVACGPSQDEHAMPHHHVAGDDDAGGSVTATTVSGGKDASAGSVSPDAGHHPPATANDAGPQQADGGGKPSHDGGADGGSHDGGANDAGTDASDSGTSGTTCSAQCSQADDCFAVPCGCADGTVEYWQGCGAKGQCLGYGVCLYDQVCAANGGLYDSTRPPATCAAGDPSACAPVTCACNDGTVYSYEACSGASCATSASCSALADDVCGANGGWVGDVQVPPSDGCPDVECVCPDGVAYVVADDRCLGPDLCDAYDVCAGDP